MEFMALGFPNYCPPRVGDTMYETTQPATRISGVGR